jgi:hypothetical protein
MALATMVERSVMDPKLFLKKSGSSSDFTGTMSFAAGGKKGRAFFSLPRLALQAYFYL